MNPDTVRFWLDRNKQVYGLVNAKSDEEMLVLYQSRYYVVRGDAAVLRSGRPVRFTTSTLPASWKKILNGGPEDGVLPLIEPDSTSSKSNVGAALCPVSTESRSEEVAISLVLETKDCVEDTERGGMDMYSEGQGQEVVETKEEAKEVTVAPKRTKKGEGAKAPKGEPVAFECPYCGHKAEVLHGRKEESKPFFQTCERCSGEYGVRIVPVTVYRAEVAAFPGKGSRK
jgi:DNA-directed RNA polymerase subunit M/transcription elongation factor TFIIS